MTYTPIGVIREELRAGLGSVEAMFDGYFVDGVAHHALIELEDDHECVSEWACWTEFLHNSSSRFRFIPTTDRPPFAWAGGAR